MLNGADFIANTKVTTPDADSPSGWRTLAEPGETCERIGPESLGWLEDQGHITRKPEAVGFHDFGSGTLIMLHGAEGLAQPGGEED